MIYVDALLDVRQGQTVHAPLVVVSGDRIAYAGPQSDPHATVPANAARVELGKVTLVPGLIDTHVHLALGGAPAANARATVAAGFTTVQDLGASDAQILSVRDEMNAGVSPGRECSRPGAGSV